MAMAPQRKNDQVKKILERSRASVSVTVTWLRLAPISWFMAPHPTGKIIIRYVWQWLAGGQVPGEGSGARCWNSPVYLKTLM